jgi:trehalose utilization protein
MRVTIWNEYRHEVQNPVVTAIYPAGIHAALAAGLRANGIAELRVATLDEPHHGLPPEVLNTTDVLVWWGHRAHDDVPDALAAAVAERVNLGMGLVALHSAHFSKPFKRLMGTSCTVRWRADGELERLWVVDPAHPCADGIPRYFELPREEMYSEPFEVPNPDELVFISWFKGGEVFRSGCCYRRGRGRIFYFRPGHETFPTYHDATVNKVIANGVRWASPREVEAGPMLNVRVDPIEPI